MPIKLKELDEESKEAIKSIEDLDFISKDEELTILVSKNILLKLTTSNASVCETNPMIRRLIMIPDLASEDKSSRLKEMIGLNKDIMSKFDIHDAEVKRQHKFSKIFFERRIKIFGEELDKLEKDKINQEDNKDIIKKINNLKSKIGLFTREKERAEKELKQISERRIEEIKSNCDEIGEIEKGLGVVLRTNHIYRYCDNCFSLTMQTETDTDNCSYCGLNVRPLVFNYLDNDVQHYLAGPWLEDYIAFLLYKKGWRIWVRNSVSGISGINHEIDILAIRNGYVLICECKTGGITREDVFNFSAKNSDIKSNYAFWLSLEKLPDTETENYLRRTPGLIYLDDLRNLGRDEILSKIDKINTF